MIGNWKMELSHKAALECARAIKKLLSPVESAAQVVVCPSYPQLPAIAEAFVHSEKVSVGAQHVSSEEKGPLTGAVSVAQIAPFVKWCIVGHSESRELWRLSDEHVRDTAALLLKHGITPIVCIGETGHEREKDQTVAVVTAQIETLLTGISRAALATLVIAYEPIWAISAQHTGEMPEPASISEVVLLIRKLIATRFDGSLAERLRVIYGGSVKPDNVAAYVNEPGVDGVLVGSASTNPLHFVEIVKRVGESR